MNENKRVTKLNITTRMRLPSSEIPLESHFEFKFGIFGGARELK